MTPVERRWFVWMRAALLARGIPESAVLHARHALSDPLARGFTIELTWDRDDVPHRITIEEPMRLRLHGWMGWYAYRAGARMLRALG